MTDAVQLALVGAGASAGPLILGLVTLAYQSRVAARQAAIAKSKEASK